jgi:hypothetical protein
VGRGERGAEELLGLSSGSGDGSEGLEVVPIAGKTGCTVGWSVTLWLARFCCPAAQGPHPWPGVLTDRRARVQLPPGDLDPASGRARLSYRRAAELFEQATAAGPGGPWTLHQLRHSALTHAAEGGANTAPPCWPTPGTPRSPPWARYARVSPAALARWQERRDPARRRC